MSDKPQINITINRGMGFKPCTSSNDTQLVIRHLIRNNGLTTETFQTAKEEVAQEIQRQKEEHEKRQKEREQQFTIRHLPKNIITETWHYAERLKGRQSNPYLSEIAKSLQVLNSKELNALYAHFATCALPTGWGETTRQGLLSFLQLHIQQTAPEQPKPIAERIKDCLSV